MRRNVSIIVYGVLCFPLEDVVDIGLGAHNTLLVTGQGVVQLHLGTRVCLIGLGQKETVGTVIGVACLVGAVFLISVGQGRPFGGDIAPAVIFRQDSHCHGGGLVRLAVVFGRDSGWKGVVIILVGDLLELRRSIRRQSAHLQVLAVEGCGSGYPLGVRYRRGISKSIRQAGGICVLRVTGKVVNGIAVCEDVVVCTSHHILAGNRPVGLRQAARPQIAGGFLIGIDRLGHGRMGDRG